MKFKNARIAFWFCLFIITTCSMYGYTSGGNSETTALEKVETGNFVFYYPRGYKRVPEPIAKAIIFQYAKSGDSINVARLGHLAGKTLDQQVCQHLAQSFNKSWLRIWMRIMSNTSEAKGAKFSSENGLNSCYYYYDSFHANKTKSRSEHKVYQRGDSQAYGVTAGYKENTPGKASLQKALHSFTIKKGIEKTIHEPAKVTRNNFKSNADIASPSITEISKQQTSSLTRRSFEGFSIAHRNESYWKVIQNNQKGISLARDPDRINDYPIIAFAYSRTGTVEWNPELLFNTVDAINKKNQSTERYRNYKYKLSTTRVDGSDCVATSFSYNGHDIPWDLATPYFMHGTVLHCIHPDSPHQFVKVGINERFKMGSRSMMQARDIQQFVDGLRFETTGISSNIGLSSIKTSAVQSPAMVRRSFDGFSITYRGGEYWIVTNKNRAGISLLRSSSGNNKSRSIVAFVYLNTAQVELTPLLLTYTAVAFDEKHQTDERHSNYKYELSTTLVDGEECLKSSFSTDDFGVPYDLGTHYVMSGINIYCIHPESPNKFVHVNFSERLKMGSRSVVKASDVQEFIDGFRFEMMEK